MPVHRSFSGRFAILALLAAAALLLALLPRLTGGDAHAAGDPNAVYAKAIAKAKKKRDNRLAACGKKRTKAKKAACRKAANTAFANAKAKAKAKRDKQGDSGKPKEDGPKESPAHEYHDCLKEHKSRTECKEQVR